MVVTDGDVWHVFLCMAAGESIGRRFAHLTRTESVYPGRVSQDLQEFVGRDAVLSQWSRSAASAGLKRIKDREIASSGTGRRNDTVRHIVDALMGELGHGPQE